MNKELTKDISKHLNSVDVKTEMAPGQARRYEPTGGVAKHNERIHRETKYVKDTKQLPFTFSKPHKPLGAPRGFECEHCGSILSGTTKTVCIICSSCNKLVKIKQ